VRPVRPSAAASGSAATFRPRIHDASQTGRTGGAKCLHAKGQRAGAQRLYRRVCALIGATDPVL
jgi:hypothetical protein